MPSAAAVMVLSWSSKRSALVKLDVGPGMCLIV